LARLSLLAHLASSDIVAAQRGRPFIRDESRQEVLTVLTTLVTQRPSALLAARTPVSAVASSPFPIAVIHAAVVDHPVVRGPLAADAPQLARVRQVHVQAELGWSLMRADGGYGINGSTDEGVAMTAAKRFFDVARSGVPPRGRPV
jgi:hypothetical protein